MPQVEPGVTVMPICIAHNEIVSNIDRVATTQIRIDAQLCFALYATSRAVTQAYGPLLAPLGVTYPQYLVLLVLWQDDGLSVGEIGARLFLDSGTLTPLLKRLEVQGLVARRRDPKDERAVRVSLTPAGGRLRAKAPGIAHDIACALDVSAAEVSALRGSLRKILHHYRENPSPISPRGRKKTP